MALLMLSFTVISKNRFSFVDMGFCVLAVAYVGIGFMYFYETREEGIIYILYRSADCLGHRHRHNDTEHVRTTRGSCGIRAEASF